MSSSKSESWGVNSVFLQEKENAQKKEMLKGEIKQEVEEEALEMKEENSTPSFDRLHFIDGSDPLNWQRQSVHQGQKRKKPPSKSCDSEAKSNAQKRRKGNFTQEELHILLTEAAKRKNVVLPKLGVDLYVTHRMREKAWDSIMAAVNRVSPFHRTKKELKKKFIDFKSLVKKKEAAREKEKDLNEDKDSSQEHEWQENEKLMLQLIIDSAALERMSLPETEAYNMCEPTFEHIEELETEELSAENSSDEEDIDIPIPLPLEIQDASISENGSQDINGSPELHHSTSSKSQVLLNETHDASSSPYQARDRLGGCLLMENNETSSSSLPHSNSKKDIPERMACEMLSVQSRICSSVERVERHLGGIETHLKAISSFLEKIARQKHS